MSHPKIDFSKIKQELEEDPSALPPQAEKKSAKAKPRGKKFITSLVIFLIIIGIIWGIKSIFSNPREETIGFWTQIKHLITSRDKNLKGEKDDRINILLLGIGGEGHDGPYLTDTIILASFKPSEKKVALLSIPRDLTVPIPGYGWRKINNANAYGEVQNPGQGAELAAATVEQVFGLPVHYYLRVDFNGFEQFIDELGGVKICVDQAFTDNLYPTDDYKTQTISFIAGCQMMDGETALRFVRSRHGNHGEGSDFARSRRQQKVLLAVKDKILSFSTLVNPLNIKKLYNQYQKHIATNLEIWEMVRLAELSKDINKDNIITKGLIEGPGGQLETIMGEDGAFLLQPPGGNYDEIRKMVADIFGESSLAAEEQEQKETIEEKQTELKENKKAVEEKAIIEIRNGTMIVGLAGKVQTYLQSLGYNVPTIGNTPLRNYEKNVIYDLSKGKFPKTIETLTQKLQANVAPEVPNWIKNITTADIVVVLGQSAQELEL
jgi:LCP family protein required for cell wall assembly